MSPVGRSVPCSRRLTVVRSRGYPRCETCLEEGAESIGVICLRIFLQGGPANVEKTDRGDWWPYGVKSYADGRYIGWPEILAIYPQYEAHFRKN